LHKLRTRGYEGALGDWGMAAVRSVDARKFKHDDSRRYITAKDCLQELEVIKLYCETHPNAVCVGGYGYFGCRPAGRKREEFIRFDLQSRQYIRSDGTVLKTEETYCGRKIPRRSWKGKEYYENQIWNQSGLGHPDLVDGDIIIEAKGGLPSANKVRTALGQLLSYKEQQPNFKVGFLFPKIWLEAESLQNEFNVLRRYAIILLPI
jgi:hypothetical protein